MTTSATPDLGSVLVTSRSFSSGSSDEMGRIQSAGHPVVRGDTTHDRAALEPHLGSTTAWVAGTAPVTAELLDLAPHLKVVARYGVGVDAVDLAAATARGIVVTNTPGANSAAVADHAVALMLVGLRHLLQSDRAVRSGDWSPRRGRELGHSTVGIVGAGRIGREVARRVSAFGARVVGSDPYLTDAQLTADGFEAASLESLASTCDVISLHAPGGVPLVTAGFLAMTSPDTILVNTARATLVDEDAVATALRERRLGFYAADTVGREGGDLSSLLVAADLADRTAFTPHIAAQTLEAVDAMSRSAAQAVLDVLGGRHPEHVVTH